LPSVAALNALKEVLKKEDDFVKDGKFKKTEATKVVSTYEKKEKRLKNLREAAGKRFVRATGTAEYDEAFKDHDGLESLEAEAIRIKARHTTNKMQSQATQKQMIRELNDVNSWANKYLKSTTLFNSGRKFTAMGAEFGDILGEYAHVWYITYKDKNGWIHKNLPASVNNRLGLSIALYIYNWKSGMFGPGRVCKVDVNRLARAMGNKIAKRVLVAFEALNKLQILLRSGFVHERTHNGRALRMLTVIDEYTRECLAIEVARKLSSQDVLRVLAGLFIRHGTPDFIRSDNGPEFTANAVRSW